MIMNLGTHFRPLAVCATVILFLLFYCTAAIAAAPSVAIPAPSGLISWWAGNGDANDQVSANNGAFAGPIYAAGYSGQAFSFDGSNIVSVSDSASLRLAQFSISLWFNWDGAGTANYEFLCSKGTQEYEIQLGGAAGTNGIRFSPAGFTASGVDALNVITSGWHHLVVTYSGLAAYVYLDGALKASRTGITGGIDLATDASPLYLGQRSPGTYPYHGKIDEALIFNRALSAAEVTAIYNAQTAGITATAAAPGVTTATLNGLVNDNGADTTVSFDYGTTASYGSTVAATPATILAGTGVKPVAAALSGLTSGTVYHFRVKAVNDAGTTYGPDQTFTDALIQSGTRLVLPASTSTYGQPMTLWAYADPTSATTGTMSFQYYDNVTLSYHTLGVKPLINGEASLTTSVIPATVRNVKAAYSGDSTYSASLNNQMLTVSKVATASTLTSDSGSTIATGQSVTYTATVSPATATGTVVFSANGDSLGTAPVVNGVATLTVSFPSPVTANITAYYPGDANHVSSSTVQLTQKVVTPVSVAGVGADMATLLFNATATGTGYFTLVQGSNASCGSGTDIWNGRSTPEGAILPHGSLPVTTGVPASYTVRNLLQGTTYTVCSTVKTSTGYSTPETATLTTTAGASASSDWKPLGAAENATSFNSLAFATDGTPYLAYANGRITVQRFDGTSWGTVGNANFSGEAINGTDPYMYPYNPTLDYVSLSFSPLGAPFVAVSYTQEIGVVSYRCIDTNCSPPPPGVPPPSRVTRVMRLNNANWEYVGTYWADAVSPSIAFAPDGTPWLAYVDQDNGSKATVTKFDGTTWVPVGTGGVSAGATADTTLAFAPDGTPFVAYRDDSNGGKASVMEFNGTSWVAVGSAGFSAGRADPLALAMGPTGTPYVAFVDGAANGKVTVMRYLGSSWGAVGGAGFTPDAAGYISLTISPAGFPSVAYSDGGNGGKANVMTFDGVSWSARGGAGIPTGAARAFSSDYAPNGQLHIAFTNGGNSDYATVLKMQYGATTSLSSSSNPAWSGDQTVVLSAPVTCGAWPYGGTVTFMEGGTSLGTSSFNSMVIGGNVATLNIANLSIGSHTITAVYGGDANCAGSTSSSLVQVVNLRPTTTGLNSSSNPAWSGDQAAVLSAPVSCSAWPYGGTVTFKEGGTTLGTSSFNSMVIGGNVATLNIANLSPGSHTITAVYGGDANCAGSASSSLVQIVNLRPTTTDLSSSSNPAWFGDQAAVLSAPVTCSAWPYGGTVTFMEGGTTLGTVSFNSTVVGGNVATLNIASLSPGSHTITAVYGGDANCAGSTSTALVQVMTSQVPLSALVSGSGDGTVSSIPQGSDPTGVSCVKNGDACTTSYLQATQIQLSATPDATSIFDSWGGACDGQSNPCTITMNGSKSVTAVFTQAPMAQNRTTGTPYGTLSEALVNANATVPDDLLLLGTGYADPIILNKGVNLSGGWNALYQSQTGSPTILSNGLTIDGGASSLKLIKVSGAINIKTGQLSVDGVQVQ